MRVLETDPSISYKMGKNRRHRIRKAKENDAEDSSDDGGQGCPHVTKAVNLAAMRKTVLKLTTSLGECTLCSKEAPKAASRDLFGGLIEGPVPAAAEDDEAEVMETTVCICLQCGHQGCDRNSVNRHALKHYKTPHSSLHSIIVNLTNWSTWCYMCDEEVPPGPRIQGCIDFLHKQSGLAKPEPLLPMGRTPDSPMAEAAPAMNGPSSKSSGSCVKVKGLSNLGNTCFFNAVMQSISQTRGLESLLVDWSKHGKLCTILGPEPAVDSDCSSSDEERDDEAAEKKPLPSIQTTYQDAGPITVALLNFLQEMKGGTTRNGTVNPNALFTQVCKKAPRFKGFQQQDSHELLRYLIDCIRMEEIKRGQSSILKFFKLPDTIHPKKVDEETKLKVKEYGRQVKHTFLDSLFGGQLVSTVKCEECKNASQIFEAFLDLSLPVMEEKPQRPNLVLIGKKKDSVSVSEAGDEGGAAAAAASAMGLDACDKPSKYQERKNKRLQKKEAKKKGKAQKSPSHELCEAASRADGDDKPTTPDQHNASDDSGGKPETCDAEKPTASTSGLLGEGDAAGENGKISDRTKQRIVENGGLEGAVGPSSAVPENKLLCGVGGGDVDSSSLAADSSPEGSKDGLEGNADRDGNSSKDDPSDADIEDNLDNEVNRRETSATNKLAKTTNNSSSGVPHQGPVSEGKDLDTVVVTASLPVAASAAGGCEDIINNNVVTISNETPAEKLAEAELCSKFNGLEAPGCSSSKDCEENNAKTFSCEVTVNNHSDVVDLSNAMGNLAVNDSAGATGDAATAGGAVGKSPSAPEPDCDRKQCPEVSATFNLSLPGNSDGLKGSPREEEEEGNHSGASASQVGKNSSSLSKVKDLGEEDESGVPSTEERQQQGGNKVLKSRQEILKEARTYSMSTLAPRYHPAPRECSVMSCLNQFTAAELLTGSNKVSCKECTKAKRKSSQPPKAEKKGKEMVYSNANKQYLIFRPPAVLTLHLKRFEQTGLTSRKVNRHVDFPLLLDLAPYCSSLCLGVKAGQSKVLYSLYGVVEHSGRLSGGHYTAYIKVRPGLGPHTQFLHGNPPNPLDLLSVYMERIVKSKECYAGQESGWPKGDPQAAPDVMDKETEARAEALVAPGRWFHISDSRVNEVTETEVLKAQAYLLFYERTF
ncbi:ubiquitin carboxyl-terminal hydrolase 45 isoform X2 [Aplysia californica]|uniref:ubiquitinyl hydrolase 1 n=1 Tax=Aplysia californica TaxID=6500 RepID=A0ABM1A0Y8_APLCA|nr:ubiquitin carboxyl-terminal hydrolase 45 isoform X2 [Aplysia californica]